jgi:hypothetical protein
MKKVFVILVLAFIGFWFTALSINSGIGFADSNRIYAKPLKAVKSDAKEFNVKPGANLKINLRTGGLIDIQGWNEDKIKVEAEGIDFNKAPIEFEQTDDGLKIFNDFGKSDGEGNDNPDLHIKVPIRFNIDVNIAGGDIKIKNVSGEIEGQTMGGDLDLAQLKGTLKLTTMGGEVTLKNSEVDGSVKTMGGEVLVENVKGDVNASSMGGKVRQINVEGKDKSIGKEVNITTMGGDLVIDTAPSGAFLKTMGGKIEVNKAGKFLNAETFGGNISAGEVDGWIKAKTMGGNIDVKMTGDPANGKRDVDLQSMGGDITLTVPQALSMDINIEIAYIKNKKIKSDEEFNRYRIISDFPVNEERTKEWDSSKGSPRKYVYGKGSVEGGKNRIRIKTINGNVYLKKG